MEIEITALLSFAVGVLSWALKEWWIAPRLQVQGDVELKSEDMIGHTLRLSNIGKRASALNCLGTITIENLNPNDIISSSYSELEKYTDAGLDIYRVDRQTKNLYFPSEGGWGSLRAVLKPKEYKGVITISPENAKPLKVKFKLIPEEEDVVIKCQ